MSEQNQLPDPKQQMALTRLVREGAMYSVMAGFGEMYLSAYALFLKMTTSEIGFLSAAPALLGSFTQLLSAWLGIRTGQRKRIIMTGVVLQALMWLPIMILPYLMPQHAGLVVIGCIVFYYAANNLAAPVWSSFMGDIVPEVARGRYFGRRSRIMNFANFLALVIAGVVLNYWKDKSLAGIGFLIIFSIAMAGRLAAAYQVWRIAEPGGCRPPQKTRSLLRMMGDLRKSLFARFSVFVALMNFSANIAGPYFAVYMLKDLHFSYLEFMMSTAVVVLMQFLTLSNWGHVSDSFGNRRVLSITAFVLPVLPALWLMAHTFSGVIAVQLLSGLAWAGFNLSAGNYVYDAVAPDRRSAYVAAHNVLGSIASFGGATLGAFLSMHTHHNVILLGLHLHVRHPLVWLFAVSALARLNTALAFVPMLPEFRSVRTTTVTGLLWIVAGGECACALISRMRGRAAAKSAAIDVSGL